MSPDVVIHLAGVSNVDYCEQPENWDVVRKVNFTGTVNVARACSEHGRITMVYISSEHVFPGRPFFMGPYTEHDAINKVGVNNYSLIKIACEALRYTFQGMKVVRTSYLFDWVRLMNEEIPFTELDYAFPTFIHRSYIYLPHFVHNLLRYAENIEFMPSVLHLAGSVVTSQYQFMSDFVRFFNVQGVRIEKRTTEWPTGDGSPVIARRPHRVGLDVQFSRKLGFPLYSYKDGFQQMAKDNVRG